MRITGNIIDIHQRKIFFGELSIENGIITDIQEMPGESLRYILPGFVDAHVHIESSMLVPTEFARMAVVHGTVATVSDPHEIANVMGGQGIRFMLDNAEKTPFKFFFGAPSCVVSLPFCPRASAPLAPARRTALVSSARPPIRATSRRQCDSRSAD